MTSIAPILPGATLGVLGGGQLGRMFVDAAHRMGYRVHVCGAGADSPAGQLADRSFDCTFDDMNALESFARSVAVVTLEFENIPLDTVRLIEQRVPVRPAGDVLHLAQHRLEEKTQLSRLGFPVTPFAAVRSSEELDAGMKRLGPRCVLKSAQWGYDGKGQVAIHATNDAADAWASLGKVDSILEQHIAFDCELSVIGVRNPHGQCETFGPVRNDHANHILDVSSVPASIDATVSSTAVQIVRDLMASLDVVGVICVEFFQLNDGQLLINEIAPRPHNSGHLTIDACVSSQFEQQVRAICALPLGSMAAHGPAAMANLLGDLWRNGEPAWSRIFQDDRIKLHLYGKEAARPGRKMGHLTTVGSSVNDAISRVCAARSKLLASRGQDAGNVQTKGQHTHG